MKGIDQLNKMLSYQLEDSKRLVSEFTYKLKDVVSADLSRQIKLVQDLIDNNIKLKTEFENTNDVNLKEAEAILLETLEHNYTAMRMLKRHNIKNNIPTSQLAIDSCEHSLNTLKTILTK